MSQFARFPVPIAQTVELDQSNPITKGLVSYIACLPSLGMVPREFGPYGKNRSFTRVGTTGTELRGSVSTAAGRGSPSAYAMATTSTGSTDAWVLGYGSNIINGSLPVTLLSLNYCNAVNTTRKRPVRYYGSSGSAVALDHGNGGSSSNIEAIVQVSGSFFDIVTASAPAAGTDRVYSHTYTPGSTGGRALYVDGAAVSVTGVQTANVVSVTDVCIGNNVTNAPFNGGVAVAGLWNRALSAAEHAALAQNPYLPLKRARVYVFKAPAAPPGGPFKASWAVAARGKIHGAGRGH